MVISPRSWAAVLLLLGSMGAAKEQPAPTYELYAIRYAVIPSFPVRGLIAGADTSRRMDIALMVWLMVAAILIGLR